MAFAIRTLTPTVARRLFIMRQRLAGERPRPDAAGILDVTRDLGCLQLDPTSAIARSHLLVTWSRVGKYDMEHLDTLLWKERHLFEYWAHAASIVLTEDYPIHAHWMRTYATEDSGWQQRIRIWVADNARLRDHILSEIEQHGPLPSKHFEDRSEASWYSSGWTANRNVNQMLGFLWETGKLMVAYRTGGHRYWDLPERCLPDWTPRETLDKNEVTKRAAQKSLRALGVGTVKHINLHYIRGRYTDLKTAMSALETEGTIERVQIGDNGSNWPGEWYIHAEDVPLLERLEAGEWQPRTTLLSPFDNLICDRTRTEEMFNFDYRIEIYVPKDKRKYGYFVLPILHGDQIIGRIDPLMNRKTKQLMVNAVYAEPDAPMNAATGRAVAGTIAELGQFLGAKDVVYGERVPAGWKKSLQ